MGDKVAKPTRRGVAFRSTGWATSRYMAIRNLVAPFSSSSCFAHARRGQLVTVRNYSATELENVVLSGHGVF